MLGITGQRRSPLDRRRSLGAIPTRSPEVEARDATGEGLLLIARFRRRRGWLTQWLPTVIEKRVELDELGAFVFGLVDGRRDVAQIVTAFLERYRVNRREAELSVVAFLRSLAGKGLIAIVIE